MIIITINTTDIITCEVFGWGGGQGTHTRTIDNANVRINTFTKLIGIFYVMCKWEATDIISTYHRQK